MIRSRIEEMVCEINGSFDPIKQMKELSSFITSQASIITYEEKELVRGISSSCRSFFNLEFVKVASKEHEKQEDINDRVSIYTCYYHLSHIMQFDDDVKKYVITRS